LEQHRGYAYKGAVWTPGYFRARLSAKGEATLVATTESWETVDVLPSETAFAAEAERRARLLSLPPAEAQRGLAAELVLAADSFIVSPVCRAGESARARAAGEEARTIIAGYHWFTDWGRDTMISLEGLTLVTGRHADARYILRTFAHVIRDGLIPNLFPEGKEEGLYQTADASLWFFHAVSRYVEASGDRKTLQALLPRLSDVIDHHLRGTRFGIGLDDRDGLLRQGADSYPLTWMDAKVGDWVVTPRRGKAVEINALWYNALRLLQGWLSEVGETREAERIGLAAERTYRSFNERFWYEEGRYLYDVVDGEAGDDSALRPNQLLAISLSHPVLEKRRWQSVLQIVKSHLLTPVGLRSLAPGHADYKREYFGDLTARDAAYHQGTVWAWLLGPFIDAWLKLHPDEREGARALLAGFDRHLEEAGMGSVSEIFDAEPPFTPRGCIAQAWSVAEVLRCWVKTSSSASS
jgi:predicted glycogen debranching enzyme